MSTTKTKLKIISLILVGLLIITAISWSTNITLKLFPVSSLAARLSGHSSKLTINQDFQGLSFFKFDDGSILIARKYAEWYSAEGLKAFPDGGEVYYILDKIDLLRVKPDGQILWQNVYIDKKAHNYNAEDSQIDNANVYQLSKYPEISALVGFPNLLEPGFGNIYKCSDSKYQFISTQQEINNGVEIDINKGLTSTINRSNLCEQKIPQYTRNIEPCDEMIQFRKVNQKAQEDYAYKSTCIKSLLDQITK